MTELESTCVHWSRVETQVLGHFLGARQGGARRWVHPTNDANVRHCSALRPLCAYGRQCLELLGGAK